MENLATSTKDPDKLAALDAKCVAELEAAGIEAVFFKSDILRSKGEVPTKVLGQLGHWGFRRAWYYWVAKGPGIPPKYATELHETYGQVVRVDGDCTCPSPLESRHGFAIGRYHVDTADGLKALADMLKRVALEATESEVKAT